MDYKDEIEKILDDLKIELHDRRTIEKKLNYSINYLDQAVARGGNKKLLKTLKAYKQKVSTGEITLNDTEQSVLIGSKDEMITLLKQNIETLNKTIESKDVLIAYQQKEIELLMKEKEKTKDVRSNTTSDVYKKKNV